ncbi:hypothetical protein CEUSTIGMA_g134.t1 [Chlamydomonas eustigma]|uniref:Pseudouridine synthase I TruA alpha/beta domain-containing protein n=1 Tax=Chlamydomonas eustigma TaxID=1157962 RepID=A0A250WPC3_9CHLO|nr:hypothetical protein CEUSTIGMA_g134.t1 [Chlamydomonas eustigma]|eukprot:GAX72678.1 hypothetical protein CEUSTIGMA_g134.t1 [Chlamydomonas eustigma]
MSDEKSKSTLVAVTVAYLGAPYQGFQRQPGYPTVEDEFLKALHTAGVLPSPESHLSEIYWARCARTDKGVSAAGNVVSFLLPTSCQEDILSRLNAALPADIKVLTIQFNVNEHFDARHSCTGRRYEYLLPVWALDPMVGVPRSAKLQREEQVNQHVTSIVDASRSSLQNEVMMPSLEGVKESDILVLDGDCSVTREALADEDSHMIGDTKKSRECVQESGSGGGLDGEVTAGQSVSRLAVDDGEPESAVQTTVLTDHSFGEDHSLPAGGRGKRCRRWERAESKRSKGSRVRSNAQQEWIHTSANKARDGAISDIAGSFFEIDETRLQALNNVLSLFHGKQSFHNFTNQALSPGSPDATRTLFSFTCEGVIELPDKKDEPPQLPVELRQQQEPLIVADQNGRQFADDVSNSNGASLCLHSSQEIAAGVGSVVGDGSKTTARYLKLVIYGRSFIMHQIRKMVGLAVAVARGSAPAECIDAALDLSNKRINVPTAPATGLLMDHAFFEGETLGEPGAIAEKELVEAFKEEHIYPAIATADPAEMWLFLKGLNEAAYKFTTWSALRPSSIEDASKK